MFQLAARDANKEKDWPTICEQAQIPDVNAAKAYYESLTSFKFRSCRWTPTEIEAIKACLTQRGNLTPDEIQSLPAFQHRSTKSIRSKIQELQDREPFTPEEDERLKIAHRHSVGDWSAIREYLPLRSIATLKKRFKVLQDEAPL
jgi:hypothetical protein